MWIVACQVPILKTYGNRGYDGDTKTWDGTYEGHWIDFDLGRA